ncbi:serine protease [Vibrio ponticus]|nr:serine protease [Vibrio ponticus]
MTLLVLLTLQGCTHSNGKLELADDGVPHVNYLPIGIPFVVGGHGTSVPLTPQVSLTAKHVAEIDYSKVIAYHPYCDLALIEQDNSTYPLPTLGIIYSYQSVTTVGKDMTGSTITGEGIYYRDVYLPEHELFEQCPASIADAPVQSGMSGGGVYNESLELVGIISAKVHEVQLLDGTTIETERISLFVPLLFARDWIVAELDDYYANNPQLEDDNKPMLSSAFLLDTEAMKQSIQQRNKRF